MATRCRVGILNEENMSVRSIYVHWDGYPSYTGKVLLSDFKENPEHVQNLIDGGYLSMLGDIKPGSREPLTLRGDRLLDKALDHSLHEWPDTGQEYEYIYNPQHKTWAVRSIVYGAQEPEPWKDLQTVLNS